MEIRPIGDNLDHCTGTFIASALAYAVVGFLLDWTSPQAVFVIAGSGVLASLGVLWFMLPAEQET